jgi:hypothetical protein
VRLLLLISLLMLAACGTPPPRLAVTGARLAERSTAGVVLEFRLEAENPGDKALPLREVSCRLTLAGEEVFRGERLAQSTLRRYGTQELILPAVVPHAFLERHPGLTEYEFSGSVTYVTPGVLAEVLFDAELIQPSESFSRSGTLDLGAATAGEGEFIDTAPRP